MGYTLYMCAYIMGYTLYVCISHVIYSIYVCAYFMDILYMCAYLMGYTLYMCISRGIYSISVCIFYEYTLYMCAYLMGYTLYVCVSHGIYSISVCIFYGYTLYMCEYLMGYTLHTGAYFILYICVLTWRDILYICLDHIFSILCFSWFITPSEVGLVSELEINVSCNLCDCNFVTDFMCGSLWTSININLKKKNVTLFSILLYSETNWHWLSLRITISSEHFGPVSVVLRSWIKQWEYLMFPVTHGFLRQIITHYIMAAGCLSSLASGHSIILSLASYNGLSSRVSTEQQFRITSVMAKWWFQVSSHQICL